MLAWFWEMFCWLDGKILSLFTRFCHWFQRLTGRTNFWLARWAVAGGAMSVMASFSAVISEFKKNHDIVAIACLLYMAYICVSFIPGLFLDGLACEKQDEDVLNEEKSIHKRIADKRNIYIRFVVCCWVGSVTPVILSDLLDILAVARGSFPLFIWIYVYLIAVNPLPPSTSKIGEWLKGLFTKSKPAEADYGA